MRNKSARIAEEVHSARKSRLWCTVVPRAESIDSAMTVTRAASKRNGRARRFPRHFANLRKPRKSTVRTGRNRQGFSAHTHRESPKISQWHIRAVWRPCCWRRMYAQDTVRHLSQPSEAAIVIHSPGSRRPEPLFDLGGADGFAAISGPWGSGKNESEVGERLLSR
jgi:hypothetical protein